MTISRRSIAVGLLWLAAVGAFVLASCRRAGQAATPVEDSGGVKDAIPELEAARQLIVVKTEDWTAVPATIEFFERTAGQDWRSHAGPFPAVTGRTGLRWGLGLHGSAPSGATGKREGDGAAPAGVFGLEQVFGFAPAEEATFLKMPYVSALPDLEGVDDPASRSYNRLVRRSEVPAPDWKSSEVIRDVSDLYRWGVVVRHNWLPQPGYGSCIYLHIWRSPEKGTSGCTAFAPETMDTLLHWLDRDAQPLLVQLPAAEYRAHQRAWRLP